MQSWSSKVLREEFAAMPGPITAEMVRQIQPPHGELTELRIRLLEHLRQLIPGLQGVA